MKCKVSDSPTNGVGRPRTCPMTTTSPDKLNKDEATHKTRNNKSIKNEGSVLRRSSRRATIERRVWSVPKKSSKLTSSNVKGKNVQKQIKKVKEKKTTSKVLTKNLNKSKPSQGTKRGLITPEEAGNARRKVKKKEGVRDVGISKDTLPQDSTKALIKEEVMLESLENSLKEDNETHNKSQNSVTYIDSKSLIDCRNVCANTSKDFDDDNVRTGIPCVVPTQGSCKNLNSSTLCHALVDSDRGLEETLFTDEVCLHKAVIEEIIPDYEISDSQTDKKTVDSSGVEISFTDGVNSSQAFRNIEDVLGHSYSKVKSLDINISGEDSSTCSNKSGKDSDIEEKDNDIGEGIAQYGEQAENHNFANPYSDHQVMKTQIECRDKLSEGRSKTELNKGEQELANSCKPQSEPCVENSIRRIHQDDSDGEEHSEVIDQNSTESVSEYPVVTKDSLFSINNKFTPEKDNCKLLGNVTQKFGTQSESNTVVVPMEHSIVEPQQDSEEEDHVSLSVALAQLVDTGCSGEGEDTETVTIHSASSVVQVAEEETARTIATLEVNTKDEVRENCLSQEEDVEDEEGELVIKEEEEDEVEGEGEDDNKNEGVESSDGDIEEDEEELSVLADGKRSYDIQSSISLVSSEKLSEICSPENNCEREVKSPTDDPHSPPQRPKKQIPPLIKISSRPPAIKTPLKCPECPMQFCTVRSLLWHFGTHGARSRENCLPPILLQDLIVPWDKPTMSLFISQSPESDKNVEKGMGCAETSLPISLSDTAGRQELTITPHVVRTEDYMGTNGDVILKIPIPRLKPKTHTPPTLKKDKFVNILPKMTASDGQTTPHSPQVNPQPVVRKLSSSPTPQITIQPQNSRSLDVVTVKPQQVPKITIRADNSAQHVQIHPVVSSHSTVQIQPLVSSQSTVQIQPITSSQSAVQIQPLVSSSHSAVHIQPLVSSSQSAVQIQPLVSSTASAIQVRPVVTSTKASSSAPSHIALIPMDNLTAVGQNLSPRASKMNHAPISMMTPTHLPVKTSTPVDGVLEKDGLVMINSNLALRIVSSLPSTLDTGTSTTNTTTIRPIASHLTNNLTILPQMEGSSFVNTQKEGTKNPDILTIVPQVDLSKKVSLLKAAAPIPSPQVPSGPKSSSAPSQVVKLYLLQPKDPKSSDSGVKFSIAADSSNMVNGIEVPLPFPFEKNRAKCENLYSKDFEESEDDDEGMVIDDEKEGDDDVMDPLSLCAVTMEDENLDASNSANQASQFSPSTATVSNDKVTIKKVPVRSKGKSIQGVDIVKYEARKYVCCYCNRRFGWSTDLKRHVILHTGEKPFQCKICPTAFTRKFLLQNHMKRMHPDKCKMSDLWP
ncbi:uncharacterized protein LOC121861494 isoform X1 [Homarus americanus]|nr:uncharacterized protein LOC121861494 isoform X1 [Homarus americanus]XP_042215220.1 uncharacterized protein LOC121861494 isoform X1 [Homarus americanus]